MTKSSSQVRCNGETVIKLRVQQGMTQEKLAAMSKVNIRTIQRAERGDHVQLETVASLAAVLKVTVSELSVGDSGYNSEREIDQNDASDSERNAVVLRRVTSGKILLDTVYDSFSGKVFCEVEPTTENIETLSAMVEEIEALIQNPWMPPMDVLSMSVAKRLRVAVALTAKLAAIEAHGVAVFAGTYTAMTQVPRYDVDEGIMYTTDRFRFEPVTICRVMLAKRSHDRVVVKVTDKWTEPAPASPDTADDIPF